MATINFLPDKLNSQPVVFRGFTTSEMGLTALISCFGGLVIAIPIAIFTSWLVIPTVTLLLPLVVIIIGGKFLAAFKRGKPENYLYQYLALVLSPLGFGSSNLIVHARKWALRRTTAPALKQRGNQ